MATCEVEETEEAKEEDVEGENEELQLQLYCGLEELLFFLKKSPMNTSFACDAVLDIIKLGVGKERPRVDTYIMPIATSCLPMLLAFLAEGYMPTLEDHLLCADAAASLLSMFPPDRAVTVISHCYEQLGDEANSVVDLALGDTKLFLKMSVRKPQGLKLCLARALLRNQHCLTRTVMSFLTDSIVTACYQYSSLTCLAFRTLHMWLSHWKKMDLSLDANDCQNIYTIVVDNWENQVPGVRKEIVKVLSNLLDVACPSSKFSVEKLIQHVMEDLSWKMKSKYFLLTLLLPRYGVLKALEKYPNLISALVTCLGATRLISAGTEVYRVCLTSFQDLDVWCYFFRDPVLSLLTSQDENLRLSQLNLLSRWLSPTLKKFPALTQMLQSELSSLRSANSEVDLALSALIHLGRKEGYIQDIWPEYSFIEPYLVHRNEEIRNHAFGMVCKKTKKTIVPISEEFEAVKKFLIENVNIDSCTLRQSLVNSFSHFLERLLTSSGKLSLSQEKFDNQLLMPTLTFLNWLHKFILENLKFGGNYQRRVTSLQLYLEVLKWFGPREVKSSKDAERVRELFKLLNMWPFESEESWAVLVDCVLSPTEDIQKVAADILANHLKLLDDEGALSRMEKLWNLALSRCSSALFYETESGSILIKLIVQFLLESPHLSKIIPPPPSLVRNGECVDILIEAFQDLKTGLESAPSLRPLLAYWHQELARQWLFCQEELLTAVTSGCSLHGVLAAFCHLVPYFSQVDVARLLFILVRIVDHFLDVLSGQAANTSVSASFAEMTQAIEQMVAECKGEEGEDYSIHMSPAHQLVLSCVWLTLKQSCFLVQAVLCHPEASGMDAVRCLVIIEKILLRCRYKGTIEAAGGALGAMVRRATSKEETRRCLPSFVPECGEKLSDFLQDILLKVLRGMTVYSNQTSITRRSAGVGILVQKIVAYDSRPDKPLLQVCLRRLFETVEAPPPVVHTLAECDLPQACALHLLSRLVQEALLRQEMLPLASAIALLCFQNFSSPIWTVQNAALQLFGVLVPLLAGEKKVHDDDMEIYGNLTTEEFFSHHPTLVAFFLEEIQKSASDQSEARKIIPVLSFLSKLTFGDNWSFDNCNSEMQEILKLFQLLMENREVTVRRLAAKCYSRFVSKNLVCPSIITFLNELEKEKKLPENKIHGYLLTLHLLLYRLMDDGADLETIALVHQNFKKINLSKSSWISKDIFQMFKSLLKHCADDNRSESLELVREVVDTLDKYSKSNSEPVGIFSWAIQCIEFVSADCDNGEICSIWKILYENNFFELSNLFINGIQDRVTGLPCFVKEQIAETLLGCISSDLTKDWNLRCSIYNILLKIVPNVSMTFDTETISTMLTISKKEENVQCWSVALPLLCEMFAPHIKKFASLSQSDLYLLKTLAEETQKRSSAEQYDVDERELGAKAFVALYKELSLLRSRNIDVEDMPMYIDVVSLMLDSGIAFLQDEDCNVRKEASKFVVPEQNPYCCLAMLLSTDGLRSVFHDFHIARYFQSKLLDFSSTETLLNRSESRSISIVSTSLFDYGTSNIYEEEAQVVCTMAHNFQDLLAQEPLWRKDLPSPPNVKILEELFTRMLDTRNARTSAVIGSSVSTSDLYVLRTRLKVAVQVSESVPSDTSTEDYKKLLELVTNALKVS